MYTVASTDNPLGWKPWQVRLAGMGLGQFEQAGPRLHAPGRAMPLSTFYSIPPAAVRYPGGMGQLAPSARNLPPEMYVPTATLPMSALGKRKRKLARLGDDTPAPSSAFAPQQWPLYLMAAVVVWGLMGEVKARRRR